MGDPQDADDTTLLRLKKHAPIPDPQTILLAMSCNCFTSPVPVTMYL